MHETHVHASLSDQLGLIQTVATSQKTTSRSIVLVQWADAHMGDGGWQELDEYVDDGETIVDTVGFLIPVGEPGSKDKHVTVWQSLCKDEGIHPMHIPVDMVRSIKVVAFPI
jgi:hypothetical protein